jgi:pectate lyase
MHSKDTLWINGPADFDKMATVLYDRIKAYKNKQNNLSAKYAPLTIVLKAGTYLGAGTSATTFANSMLTVQEQGDLTIMGEKDVILKFGINIKRGWNILIRNITFQDYYDDGINIGEPETHHIWVDHCTVGNPTTMPADHEHPDGGIDIKTGASYVTISWCKYRNSWKTGLVGHSDSNGSEDLGKLKVTYFGNYFFHTNSRNPRVRFGNVHVLNNLEEQVQLYGIAAANTSQVYAENNFFLNTDWPMYADRTSADFKAVYGNNSDNTYTSKTGNYPATGLKQVGNAYDDSGLPVITAQIKPDMLNPGGRSIKFDEFHPELVFDPHSYYDYAPLNASDVRVIVPIFAGVDKVQYSDAATLPLNLLSFNVTLGSGNNKEANAVWKTTNEINAASFNVERSENAKDFITVGNVSAKNTTGTSNYSFTDAKPLAGLSYYRLKMFDKDGQFKYSNVVVINNSNSISFGLYPNPATNNITVTHSRANAGAVIKVVSADGKTVIASTVSFGSTLTTLQVAKLTAGNYLVVFDNGLEKTSARFIKQ